MCGPSAGRNVERLAGLRSRVQCTRVAMNAWLSTCSFVAWVSCAGVKRPSAVVVCHSIPQLATQCVESIRAAYKTVPIYACAQSFK